MTEQRAAPREDPWEAVSRAERRAALAGVVSCGALLVGTGAFLVSYRAYHPSSGAPVDWDHFQTDVVRGMVARNLHRWGTQAMAVVVGLHVTFLLVSRITRGRALRFERRGVIAAASLFAALALILTAGWLVPWDALSVSAVIAVTEPPAPVVGNGGPFDELIGVAPRYDARALLTAGRLITPATLWRFWILHGGVLPVLGASLLALHFRWGRAKRVAPPSG